jgi:hypothetical protein
MLHLSKFLSSVVTDVSTAPLGGEFREAIMRAVPQIDTSPRLQSTIIGVSILIFCRKCVVTNGVVPRVVFIEGVYCDDVSSSRHDNITKW